MEHECPACHKESTDPVDCSWCGAPMSAAPAAPIPGPSPAAATAGTEEAECPVCSLPRPANGTARFCPSCRYDYKLHKKYDAPAPVADPADGSAAADPGNMPQGQGEAPGSGGSGGQAAVPIATFVPFSPPAVPSGVPYDLLVNVDLTLKGPDAPDPTDLRERVFPLDYVDHLVGRRSDKDNIHPEIVLPDTGVSRRHARFTREPDGSMTLMDLGSANGTVLNGKPMTANVKYPVTGDDDITMGCWTRLKLRPR